MVLHIHSNNSYIQVYRYEREEKQNDIRGKYGIWNEMIDTILELAIQKTCDF